MLLGCIKPALYRSHGNIQQLCNLVLRHLFPEVQVENLLILISKPFQGFPHSMHHGKAQPSGCQLLLRQFFDGYFHLGCFGTEIIIALIPGDADDPGFESILILQSGEASICT